MENLAHRSHSHYCAVAKVLICPNIYTLNSYYRLKFERDTLVKALLLLLSTQPPAQLTLVASVKHPNRDMIISSINYAALR